MNETNQPSAKTEDVKSVESERTKQVTVVGWTAGLAAFFAAIALINHLTWPVASGIAAMAAMAAMVTAICYFILKR